MMRNVILYIAMSLDGFIADRDGGVDWLGGDGSDSGHPGSYPAFIETVDTIILGYKTYHQITTELSPNQWIYAGKKTYVLTHRPLTSTHEIFFTDETPAALLTRLRCEQGKQIWICGGAAIVNQLLDLSLIDRFWITVIPTILGGGVRLFSGHEQPIPLQLLSTQSYNGMTDLVFAPRH